MRYLILFISIFLYAKNVLILNSYRYQFEWVQGQDKAIINTLKNSKFNKDLKIYVEFMDTKRFKPTPSYESSLLSYYDNKYQNIDFDIVITTDDNALNFARKYKNMLFKNAKIFFSGVNNLSLAKRLDKNSFAGVFEKKNPIENLNFALKANPKLKKMYIITDNTHTGLKELQEYKNEVLKISKKNNLDIEFLNYSKLEDILVKLKDKNSYIYIWTIEGFTYKNHTITGKLVLEKFSKIHNFPIVIQTYIYIKDKNVIGGYCTDAYSQGKEVAKKVIEFLNGKDMKQIGFLLDSPNRLYINVKNMKKFGINYKKFLNENPILVNKPKGLWEEYKEYIIVLIIISIIVVIFLIILSKKNYELKEKNRIIEELNKNLEKKVQTQVEEIRQKEAMLFQQSKLASLGEMITAISHQWRQPLNALAIKIQMLENDYEDGVLDEKRIDEFIKENMELINFMSKTIDNFRNFARKDNKKEKFNMKEAVDELINMLNAQLKNSNITLEIRGEATIESYKNELQQILLNLINNAKDALIENGVENKKIIIEIKENEISVIDNGGGIPNEVLIRVFEPYFTTKEEGKGTGLGLYMSKTIASKILNAELIIENYNDGVKATIKFNS